MADSAGIVDKPGSRCNSPMAVGFRMSDENLPEPREPTKRDLTELCRGLNQLGALYVVIGGMAMKTLAQPL